MAPESESPKVTHRRRRSSAWQRTPLWVKIGAAVCLGLLGIGVALRDRITDMAKKRGQSATSQASSQAPRADAGKAFDSILSKVAPIDLELTEASLNGKTRRIEGVAMNRSDHPYSDIRITFALPTPDFSAQDLTMVTIARLEPHASVRFASDRVPDAAHQWALVGITGTPH